MSGMEDMSVEEMILAGIIEVSAIDSETGDFLYTFTNKVKEALPELYEMHINAVHNEIMYFWEKGLVHIDNFESKNPIVSLTDRAFDEEYIQTLSDAKQRSLKELKRILKVI